MIWEWSHVSYAFGSVLTSGSQLGAACPYPKGTFGNVQRHFCSLQLEGRCCWHLVDRSQRSCSTCSTVPHNKGWCSPNVNSIKAEKPCSMPNIVLAAVGIISPINTAPKPKIPQPVVCKETSCKVQNLPLMNLCCNLGCLYLINLDTPVFTKHRLADNQGHHWGICWPQNFHSP